MHPSRVGQPALARQARPGRAEGSPGQGVEGGDDRREYSACRPRSQAAPQRERRSGAERACEGVGKARILVRERGSTRSFVHSECERARAQPILEERDLSLPSSLHLSTPPHSLFRNWRDETSAHELKAPQRQRHLPPGNFTEGRIFAPSPACLPAPLPLLASRSGGGDTLRARTLAQQCLGPAAPNTGERPAVKRLALKRLAIPAP